MEERTETILGWLASSQRDFSYVKCLLILVRIGRVISKLNKEEILTINRDTGDLD